jgi:hypothetical protein
MHPSTYRLQGILDRGMTADERSEFIQVVGHEPEIVSTDMACGPEVDPYECNVHGLSVDGLTFTFCWEAVEKLQEAGYWRGAPTCRDMTDVGT